MLCEVCGEELVHRLGCRLQHRLVHVLHDMEGVWARDPLGHSLDRCGRNIV